MVGISSSWQSNAQGMIGLKLLLYLFSFIEGWRAGCSSYLHLQFIGSPGSYWSTPFPLFPPLHGAICIVQVISHHHFFTTLNMKAQGLHTNSQLLQPRGCLLDQGLHSKPDRHRMNSTFILTWPLPKNNTLRRQTQKSFPRQISVNRFLTSWKPGAAV